MTAIGRKAAAALALTVVSLLAQAPVATAAAARPSLMDIENDVMCVVCNEPLAVAQSPQAYREKNFIRGLIAQGYSKAQIERALVGVYGTAVLGRPPAHGFNLTVYVLPPAIIVAGVVILAFTLPRWRRRVRAAQAMRPSATGPPLTSAEEQRLDEELTHFRG